MHNVDENVYVAAERRENCSTNSILTAKSDKHIRIAFSDCGDSLHLGKNRIGKNAEHLDDDDDDGCMSNCELKATHTRELWHPFANC